MAFILLPGRCVIVMNLVDFLCRVLCLFFAGAERGSRDLQILLNPCREWMRAAEHTPRGSCILLVHRHGFAEIAKRSAIAQVNRRLRVKRPHLEHHCISFAQNASSQADETVDVFGGRRGPESRP